MWRITTSARPNIMRGTTITTNYDFFTYPRHLLEGNYFQVDIRIRGEWIDELIKFRFKARGGTFEIER